MVNQSYFQADLSGSILLFCHFTHKVAVKRKHKVAAALGKSFVSVPASLTSQITLNHKVALRTDGKQIVAVSSGASDGVAGIQKVNIGSDV